MHTVDQEKFTVKTFLPLAALMNIKTMNYLVLKLTPLIFHGTIHPREGLVQEVDSTTLQHWLVRGASY